MTDDVPNSSVVWDFWVIFLFEDMAHFFERTKGNIDLNIFDIGCLAHQNHRVNPTIEVSVFMSCTIKLLVIYFSDIIITPKIIKFRKCEFSKH